MGHRTLDEAYSHSVAIGVWAAEAWTAENDASPNVDTFDSDYKRIDKHIYIYLATIRIMVVGFTFHLHLRIKFQ